MLDTIRNFDRKQWGLIAIVLIASTALSACAQIIDRFIQVDTPPDAASAEGLAERMNLRDSAYALHKYTSDQERIIGEWSSRVADGRFISDSFRAFSMEALNPENITSVLGFNPVGPAAITLAFVTGLMRRRPGDVPAKDVPVGDAA